LVAVLGSYFPHRLAHSVAGTWSSSFTILFMAV
jgi:hypothetical protein